MTPEQRAGAVEIVEIDMGDGRWEVDVAKTDRNIADAIRAAVAAERQACADIARRKMEQYEEGLKTASSIGEMFEAVVRGKMVAAHEIEQQILARTEG